MPPRKRAPAARPAAVTGDVTAVLVACDGARWLPEALAALAASSVAPARIVCVDAGSTDGSAELMAAAYGDVATLPRGTGFGAAVAHALAGAPPTTWLWLLHDDAAPEPTALAALLAYADDSPSAVLLGPKARDWEDPRVLVEVGVSTDPGGHRETGLDRREYDQGQHDAVRDVLAVGTAGALIRRDVWESLGGLDPLLPVFRDDLDLGWRVNAAGQRVVVVPTAVIRHVRAATTGRRQLPAAAGRPAAIDRRNALFVLLAHAAGPRLLLALPRLALGCVLRALGFLLTRQVVAAGDELTALPRVLARPGRLASARKARADIRTVSPRTVTPLLASRTERLRGRLEAIGGWLSGAGWSSGGGAPVAAPLGALGDAGPEGPDDLADLPSGGGVLKRLLVMPGVAVTGSLALIALLAERDLLSVRGGTLVGGRLLPVPSSASALWASYAEGWHSVAVGSAAPAHPSIGLLAALSWVLLGKAWLAVDVLLLGSVPIAAAVAYAASGRLTAHPLLRVWAAATWALLPVATGAIRDGRLDVAVGQIALPPLLVSCVRLLRTDVRVAGWRRAWGLGLGLGIAAAFSPLLWPLVGGGLLLAAVASHSARRIIATLVAAVVPAALLLPWSLALVSHPGRLLDGPGRLLPAARVPAWQLVLLQPGSVPFRWLAVGLVLAGLAALLRRDAHRFALAAWTVAILAYAAAVVLRQHDHWPGVPLQLAGAAVLAAALLGADGVRTRLAQSDFGWRQASAAVLAVAAAALPLLAAVSWVQRGAADPLHRGVTAVLPAFVRAELSASPGLRALIVRPRGTLVGYELTTADGDRMGAADTAPASRQQRALDAVVADLLSARGSDAAAALATRAVRYVALPAGPGAEPLIAALDAQAGLTRRASGQVLLWRVVAPSSRLSLLPAPAAAAALRGDRAPTRELLRTAPPRLLPAGAATTVPTGAPGRLLVLAEARSRGWRGMLDGKPLRARTAWGWAQAFVLPARGGRLVVSYDEAPRHRALVGELAAWIVVAVLAAPNARRRRGLEVVDDEAVVPDDAVRTEEAVLT